MLLSTANRLLGELADANPLERKAVIGRIRAADVVDDKTGEPVALDIIETDHEGVDIDALVKQALDERIKNFTPPTGNKIMHAFASHTTDPTRASKAFSTPERAKAFSKWLLGCKGMNEGTNTAGGFLVPEEYANEIIDLVNSYGVARQNLSVHRMKSDTRNVPKVTGRLTASYVGEGVAGDTTDPTFGNIQLNARKLIVMSIASSEVLEDAEINLADWAAMDSARAIALAEDEAAFIGDGTSTYGGITGVVTKLGDTWSSTSADSAGIKIATGNAFAEVTINDITALMGKLPTYARRNAKFYCSPAFADAVMLRLIKASGGVTGAEMAQGMNTLLGYPLVRTEVMVSTEANSAIPLLFGDLTMAGAFGDRRQVRFQLTDTGTVGGVDLFASDQVALKTTSRYDVNIHEVGDGDSTAGPIVGLRLASA